MKKTQLRYVNLTAEPGGANPRLQLVTPSGQLREVPLSPRELANVLANAANIVALQMRTGEEA